MTRSNKKLWFAVIGFLTLIALFGFAQSPLFSIQKIEVQGNKLIPRSDLLALANIGEGSNIFRLSSRAVLKNITLHPLVKKAQIQRRLPNTLVIIVQERQSIAMIPVADGFALVDGQGIFLQRSDTWPKDPLPVISGVRLPDNLNLGQAVDNPGLSEGLRVLSGLPREIYPLVGELYAGNQDKLVLYTRDGLEIRLGMADQVNQKFAVMRKFLADSNYKTYRTGYYVDLTTGKPVLGKR